MPRHGLAHIWPRRLCAGSSRSPVGASAWKNSLVMQPCAGVRKAGEDILTGQTRIVAENVSLCPTLSQEIDDELHGQSGTFDDGFADQHVRIHDNSGLPLHDDAPTSSCNDKVAHYPAMYHLRSQPAAPESVARLAAMRPLLLLSASI